MKQYVRAETRRDIGALIQQFRSGRLFAESLAESLAAHAVALTDPDAQRLRQELEQCGIRIEAILLGVCEDEQAAHVEELLRELESKFSLVEP